MGSLIHIDRVKVGVCFVCLAQNQNYPSVVLVISMSYWRCKIKKGGVPKAQSQMQMIRDSLDQCGLVDLVVDWILHGTVIDEVN